ncbi:MAG: PUA domain-containing protein, partial [Gammaproteobacteria bacterium]
EVHELDDRIQAMAGESATDTGSGGMITKLAAARIALGAGCHMVIANGRRPRPLQALEQGAACTWFVAGDSPAGVRKQWIAGSLRPHGAVHVDGGAAAALDAGKSLLPAGVVRVEGQFERGDAVVIYGPDGAELAHGLSAYGASEAGRIAGRRSADIAGVLGYRGPDELVHRNDLAMIRRKT